MVFLKKVICDGAIKIAERIRSNIVKAEIEHKNSLPMQVVTLSLGVATLETPASSSSHEELINNADIALYQAKEQGRNRVCCFGDSKIIAQQKYTRNAKSRAPDFANRGVCGLARKPNSIQE